MAPVREEIEWEGEHWFCTGRVLKSGSNYLSLSQPWVLRQLLLKNDRVRVRDSRPRHGGVRECLGSWLPADRHLQNQRPVHVPALTKRRSHPRAASHWPQTWSGDTFEWSAVEWHRNLDSDHVPRRHGAPSWPLAVRVGNSEPGSGSLLQLQSIRPRTRPNLHLCLHHHSRQSLRGRTSSIRFTHSPRHLSRRASFPFSHKPPFRSASLRITSLAFVSFVPPSNDLEVPAHASLLFASSRTTPVYLRGRRWT